MRYTCESENVIIGEKTETKINLFIQFFIHPNKERLNEIKTCLTLNVMNPFINNIILLNETETIYTDEELGCCSKKIVQLPLGKRMMYSDIISYVDRLNIEGYIIIANSDIFFDETIENILKSDMNIKPILMTQLRYEYDGTPTGIKVFGPRPDSQDTWIYHKKWNPMLNKYIKAFNFQLGKPGCDNHITYLFKICGFSLVNDPELVHTLHYHKTQIRNYTKAETIKPPYIYIIPVKIKCDIPLDVNFDDNYLLFYYLKGKIERNEPFVIPRVAGVENNTAYRVAIDSEESLRFDTMKNNAGVQISSKESCKKYSEAYFKAFENCQVYTGWDKNRGDNVYGGIVASQNYIENTYPNTIKVWAESCLDIFNYVNYEKVWTQALEGKRILIISSFIESIREKEEYFGKIYGKDMFINNTFVYIKPPSLSADSNSREWDIELKDFCTQLDSIKDQYDIALVSCGGLGNLVSDYIYSSGKSAIYVGGVLSVWFGVYNRRMLDEKSSMLRMYLNEYWSRPKISERPLGWNKIESGAYW
jgi:hypothetical protein